MFSALEEAAIPHVLTNLLLLGNRDTIMLLATLILFICSARIVKMTIITPIQAVKSVAVPSVAALAVLRALEDRAAKLVLTDFGLQFKRLALMLRAAPILFVFSALPVTSPVIVIVGITIPARTGRGGCRLCGWSICGWVGISSPARFLLTLVPIALQSLTHFTLSQLVSLRLSAASLACGL
jgi:hypothetical protein